MEIFSKFIYIFQQILLTFSNNTFYFRRFIQLTNRKKIGTNFLKSLENIWCKTVLKSGKRKIEKKLQMEKQLKRDENVVHL